MHLFSLTKNNIQLALRCLLIQFILGTGLSASIERHLETTDFKDEPITLKQSVDESGIVTWWLPDGADSYTLPIAAGVEIDPNNEAQFEWLRESPSWSLMELPVVAARYGSHTLVMIAPWPNYGRIVIEEKLGIRFELPTQRHNASPADVVVVRRKADPLAAAYAFRDWRQTGNGLGAIPATRTLTQKIKDLPSVERLLGAPHFYLWGPALFSQHDVPKSKWIGFAKALRDAESGSFGFRILSTFSTDQNNRLQELAKSGWPAAYLTQAIAAAIDSALTDAHLLDLPSDSHPTLVSQRNRSALFQQFSNFLRPMDSWGDGFSKSLLKSLHEAGVERANLVLSDLYAQSAKPEVAAYAEELGYLIGPYDSYHSVHSPEVNPDETWETAQFDMEAYEQGRVVNADGSGHAGFKETGFHFSPKAAWPYVQQRVNGITGSTDYSTWFIDCDATGECFDDFSSSHSASRVEDSRLRRHRLDWIESNKGMVVGSEGGSVIFSDVIHYGHGVNTPYIGHLSPAFKDKQSPYFLGRHWPPDEPEMYFKPIPVPPSLKTPFFDPTVRIPLYQAALGDQVITTHHWNFDSLKFSDIEHTRELIEILYMVPPMYHLNRNAWENRKEKILRHLAFWSPLHQKLATAPLIKFEYLSDNRLIQRTTYTIGSAEVTITVNFSDTTKAGVSPFSASVSGLINLNHFTYSAYSNVN